MTLDRIGVTGRKSSEADSRSSSGYAASRDHKAEPKDMDGEYLVDLTLQLYARACSLQCSRELHERAFELVAELKRRVEPQKSANEKLRDR